MNLGLPESSNPDGYWTCNFLNRSQMGSIESGYTSLNNNSTYFPSV